jgi:hypothetical protein
LTRKLLSDIICSEGYFFPKEIDNDYHSLWLKMILSLQLLVIIVINKMQLTRIGGEADDTG